MNYQISPSQDQNEDSLENLLSVTGCTVGDVASPGHHPRSESPLPDSSTLLSSSLYIINGSGDLDIPEESVEDWSAADSTTHWLATPPPQIKYKPTSSLFTYPGILDDSTPPYFSHAGYVHGSSSEESPLSSPRSEVVIVKEELALTSDRRPKTNSEDDAFHSDCATQRLSTSSPVNSSAHFLSVQSSGEEESPIPEGVKMPQRKGGIQLWQFLYALLTDAEHTHPELIEWTCNERDDEFRLLEPEAIAVWWGYHKNKPNMSYDKFSRSLRYYYDKGILRKIPGERYVYRFCVDPERMYKHIGISGCRPQLKPMPEVAKLALSKYQSNRSNIPASICSIVAPAPEPLSISKSSAGFLRQGPNDLQALYPALYQTGYMLESSSHMITNDSCTSQAFTMQRSSLNTSFTLCASTEFSPICNSLQLPASYDLDAGLSRAAHDFCSPAPLVNSADVNQSTLCSSTSDFLAVPGSECSQHLVEPTGFDFRTSTCGTFSSSSPSLMFGVPHSNPQYSISDSGNSFTDVCPPSTPDTPMWGFIHE